MEQKTPLYDRHVSCHGKMVPFAGYLLPVQYEQGVIAEHLAVRNNCGMFDVSHMGEVICQGPNALSYLNWLLTNDFTNMTDGQARYSLMCNERGGVVDDLIVYKIRDGHYLIVVNAANRKKDYEWMMTHQKRDVELIDISDKAAQIAVQGPKAKDILKKVTEESALPRKYYHANFHAEIKGIRCIISKTGYTGEDGYELYMDSLDAPALWDLLLEAGAGEGMIPCGLGARDTLRLEAAMPLYGHEMDEEITPMEAGLGFAVKFGKEDFVGKPALEACREPSRIRVGLKVTGRGIIREHNDIYVNERIIGQSTSGTHCPYLGYPVAMALVSREYAAPKTIVEADVRGRRVTAEVVPLPFYKRTDKG